MIADGVFVLGAGSIDGLGHDHVWALGRHDARQAREKMLGYAASVDVADRHSACSPNDTRINDLGVGQVLLTNIRAGSIRANQNVAHGVP